MRLKHAAQLLLVNSLLWGRLKAGGVTVSRATLPTQSIREIELLFPIYDAQERSIFSSSMISMDDTWMKVGVVSPGKMHKGHFWPIYGDKDGVAFPYGATRALTQAKEMLGEFAGTLLTDGYSVYS